MRLTQIEKASRFQSLHQGGGVLLMPNPWDGGSARMLKHLGFKALATSSGASAGTFGRRDGKLSREEALTHVRMVVAATDLPVSADLESGFSPEPAEAAKTLLLAAEIGVGGSIEDYGQGEKRQYDISHAADRIAAAVEALRALPFPFVLTARAENFFRGNPDLDDTIRRLVAYEAAGADVLFAPCLPDLDAVRAVCAATRKPVNFMVGIKGKSFSVGELASAGVRRISFASSLYRTAMTAVAKAAQEIQEHGTFNYLEETMTGAELNRYYPQ